MTTPTLKFEEILCPRYLYYATIFSIQIYIYDKFSYKLRIPNCFKLYMGKIIDFVLLNVISLFFVKIAHISI